MGPAPLKDASGSLQAAFDHIDQALADILHPGMVEAAQWSIYQEHRQTMYG